MTGQTISHYRILDKLGEGGMGVVYKAEDTKLRRTVALKFLPPHAQVNRDRFLREAQAAAALNHPNICTVFEIDEEHGFLAMELIDGVSVKDKIAARPLPLEEALDIAIQSCAGLQAAHEKGIVHRDIKPANLMVTAQDQVKIMDFGLAQVGDRTRITKTGSSLGTPAYMSPEQSKGDSVDRRTDVWSLGVVLYEMLAGRLPFRGDTEQAVSYGIVHAIPEPLTALRTGLPVELDRLLAKALSKDPAERYQHAADLSVDLRSIRRHPSSAAPVPPAHGAPRWFWAAGGALASIALMAAAWLIPSVRTRFTQVQGSVPAEARIHLITRYTGTERDGALSPDGKHFAFVSEMGGQPDMWVRQVSGGDPVRLTNDPAGESSLTYAPDGQSIYYTSRAAIWRIGALGGNPSKILEGANSPSLSADGKRLAYLRGQDLEIANADGTGATKVVDALGFQGRASLSPDGSTIAFTRGNLFETVQLYIIDASGRNQRQITRFRTSVGIAQAAAHTWMPDGRHLLLSRGQDLWIAATNAEDFRRLTLNHSGQFQSLSVSADGSRLAASVVENEYEVWKAPLGGDPEANGRAAQRLLDRSSGPMWIQKHPDSRLLLVNSWATGVRNLWIHPLDGSAPPRQITEIDNDAVTHAALSPDGNRVAYTSLQTGNAEIWVRNTDGSNPVQLTSDPASDFWPAWTRDGKWLSFTSLRGGTLQFWKLPAAGGQAVQLTKERGTRGDWSPVADHIAFAMERLPTLLSDTRQGVFGPGQIQVADFDGNILLRIPWPDANITLPSWSPDGKRFSAIRRESPLNTSVWIFDARTGQGRIAVKFPGRFHPIFRVCWTADGESVLVNRFETTSHIVLLENFQ